MRLPIPTAKRLTIPTTKRMTVRHPDLPPITHGLRSCIPLIQDAKSIYNSGGGVDAIAPANESVDAVGTYVDPVTGLVTQAQANVLRIERKGARIEGERTNLLLRSEDFTHADWSRSLTPIISANQAVAPDGAMTADTIEDDNASGTEGVFQDFTVVANVGPHVHSVFIRKTTGAQIVRPGLLGQYLSTTLSYAVSLNTTTGAVTAITTLAPNVAPDAFDADDYGDYWRLWMVIPTKNRTVYRPSFLSAVATDADPATWATNVVGTHTFWGAQAGQAAFPSSYIPTTSAAVTRAADDLRYASAGNLIGGASGTIILAATPDFDEADANADKNIFAALDTGPFNGVQVYYADAGPFVVCDFWQGGAPRAALRPTTNLTRGVTNVWAMTWATNNFRVSVDGAQEDSDTGGAVPDTWPTNMLLGQSYLITNRFDGTLAHLMLYDRAVSSSEITTLTDWILSRMGL